MSRFFTKILVVGFLCLSAEQQVFAPVWSNFFSRIKSVTPVIATVVAAAFSFLRRNENSVLASDVNNSQVSQTNTNQAASIETLPSMPPSPFPSLTSMNSDADVVFPESFPPTPTSVNGEFPPHLENVTPHWYSIKSSVNGSVDDLRCSSMSSSHRSSLGVNSRGVSSTGDNGDDGYSVSSISS